MNQSSSATGSSLLPLLRVPFSSAARSSSTSLQQSLRMGGYHAYGIHPDRLFGVGALAPRGLHPFIGGLCGDHSPHRTTMTQTKRCPIFKFGSWWCFLRQTPQESDCEINASFAQGCGCVINASRRCGRPCYRLLRHRSVKVVGTCCIRPWRAQAHERSRATTLFQVSPDGPVA